MKIKHLFFILLVLCIMFFLSGCGGSGGGSSGGSGGGEGGDDGPGRTFIITNIVPNDVEGFQVIPGKGIKFTYMGFEFVIQDKVVLSDNGNVTDTLLIKMDGETGLNSVFTGKWTPSGTTINAHFTKEKDKLKGKTKDIDQHGSAVLSADGNSLSNSEIQGDLPFKFIYTKQ